MNKHAHVSARMQIRSCGSLKRNSLRRSEIKEGRKLLQLQIWKVEQKRIKLTRTLLLYDRLKVITE